MRSVLMVCLGNICRSPLAEGILRREAAARGVPLFVDSAGTGDYHIGSLPDERACAEGTVRGCEMTMRARQVVPTDFERFDLVIAMDAQNRRNLLRMAGPHAAKVRLLREFDPTAPPGAEVPDPYYDGPAEFAEVAEMVERAVEGMVKGLGSQGVRESGSQGVRSQESGSQGVRESGSQGVRESGSQGVRESGSQGVRESFQ